MKDLRKKALPLIIPVLWSANALLWCVTFLLDLCKGTNPLGLIVLHGISALLGLVVTACNWIRYFKDR